MKTALCVLPLAVAFADSAHARESLPSETPAPALSPICTDRPGKADAPCTVPKGRWQAEADVINWSRFDAHGVRTDTTLWTNPTLKYGLTDRLDAELNWSPYATVRTTVEDAPSSRTIGGPGDVFVRLKWSLKDSSAPVSASLIPYVKFPTARRGIGNREAEGGLLAPIAVKLPNELLLTIEPELDVLADRVGSGRHLNVASVVNIAWSATKALTLSAELWGGWNFDPAGQVNQYTADIGAAYLVNTELQLDAGANFGLNSRTPDVQAYLGVSQRF